MSRRRARHWRTSSALTPARLRIWTASASGDGHDSGQQVLGVGDAMPKSLGDLGAVLDRLLEAGLNAESVIAAQFARWADALLDQDALAGDRQRRSRRGGALDGYRARA
jgi:hypothetical protein